MVNQAALTGESMPVRKVTGATVYAGTVVEEGECVLTTKAEGGTNRYDKIVAMIEESEKLKSSTENRALALADRLVPWCLGATIVTYALTRNATRAISCLMVDFSCALKLSMPLAVLSAMRECGASHITVNSIFSATATSAGSHSTSVSSFLVSHLAASCSFSTRSPFTISHQKQSIER